MAFPMENLLNPVYGMASRYTCNASLRERSAFAVAKGVG
jgi:hypothetical protein